MYYGYMCHDIVLSAGMLYKPDTSPEGQSQAQCAPFALFPSVVPRQILQQATDCMKDFNTLMYRVAQDHEFLEAALRRYVCCDCF